MSDEHDKFDSLWPDESPGCQRWFWAMALVVIFALTARRCLGEEPQYHAAYSSATKVGKPLVVGVGCAVPTSTEWVSVSVRQLTGYRAPCVVIGSSDGLWIATLLPGATAGNIRSVLRGQEVQRSVPFQDRASADDEALATGPWQAVVKGFKWYDKAKYGQRIAITNGQDSNKLYRIDQDDHWSGSPSSPNPNRLFPWAVSGGMDKMTGWRSRAAVLIPGKVRVWQERVEAGASRLLPMYRWSFPDGTVFADVLSSGDKVFEVRTRTKVNGEWKNRVAWHDAGASPKDFHGAGKACASCHEHAGAQQGYGIRIRGSDETFSWTPFVDGSFTLNRDEWPLE